LEALTDPSLHTNVSPAHFAIPPLLPEQGVLAAMVAVEPHARESRIAHRTQRLRVLRRCGDLESGSQRLIAECMEEPLFVVRQSQEAGKCIYITFILDMLCIDFKG
jgi:hypothetical protein